MKFSQPFTTKEQIELLQRSILVNAYAYYEMNATLLQDYQYDRNALQLEALKNEHPDIFKKSRYYKYFSDFEPGTGFDLVSKVQKSKAMRKKIERDASVALKLKLKEERHG
jgi:NAD-dependent DNA ligase